MRELEYPFDSKRIMRKRRAYKQVLLEDGNNRIHKNIAVLGGSTTNDVVDMLELFLLNYGIEPSFYQSEYGRFWEDAVFENPELDDFRPDLVYIHTTNRNISTFPALSDSKDTVVGMRSSEFDRYKTMWESLLSKYCCPIIQNNFELPYARIIGNMDSYAMGGYKLHHKTEYSLF